MHYAFENSGFRNLGGAELQSYMLAKELDKRGFDICLILKENVSPSGNIKRLVISKKKVIRILSVFRAMNRINSDLYYQRTGGFITGIVALFCMLKGKKFVVHISNINQCCKDSPKDKNFAIKAFYRWALKRAARIIVQTQNQKAALKANFGRESVIIRNMMQTSSQSHSKENMVLWVGTVNKRKRPEIFLKLAQAMPECKFVMIGGSGDESNKEFYRKMQSEAGEISNLEFLGFRPLDETERYFQRCKVFVNTSSMDEGFPNTYLQAWANHAPVVALEFDPDETIRKNSIGMRSGNASKLAADVRLLMENEKVRKEMGLKARSYVEKNHKVNKITEEFIELFEGIAD